jgi:ABC-type lipoprotein export system ATPase subunit
LALFQEISQNEGITVLMVSHDGLVDEYVEEILTLKSGMLA